jgi:hypothetical protein
MYAVEAARLRSARSWLRHSHASLRHSLATLQTYGLLIRVAKPSYSTGTLCAIKIGYFEERAASMRR